VNHDYTDRNQIASIAVDGSPPLASYTYDLDGNRTTKNLENGTEAAYGYDDASRMTNIVHSAGLGVFASFEYGYDTVDRRTFAKRETGRGDVYGYDAVDQVANAWYEATDPDSAPANPLREVSYDWDASGNRAMVTHNETPTAYTANDLNQYTEVGGKTVTHNANGNLVAHAGWTYVYDAQNRIKTARNAGIVVSFFYDPANRVARRVANRVNALFYYDGWNLIEERNGIGTELARYIHGAWTDEMLVRITANPSVYYHHDSIGSVTHLTDGAGNVVEKYTYDIFGAADLFAADGSLLTTSAFGNRFLFTGREAIPETDLMDYRNRVYSPELGRFLQTDPLGFDAGDYNLYRYVANNPVGEIDPDGLDGNDAPVSVTLNLSTGQSQASYHWSNQPPLANIIDVALQAGSLIIPMPIRWSGPCSEVASKLVTVSRWGGSGLKPGNWVMKGSASRSNYILSGKYQPASWPGNNVPAPFSSGQTFTVPTSSLQTPPGFLGSVKGAVGQRIYQPPP